MMLDNLGSNGVVQLDKSSINCFLSCVKHALLLAGDASASINIITDGHINLCFHSALYDRIYHQ